MYISNQSDRHSPTIFCLSTVLTLITCIRLPTLRPKLEIISSTKFHTDRTDPARMWYNRFRFPASHEPPDAAARHFPILKSLGNEKKHPKLRQLVLQCGYLPELMLAHPFRQLIVFSPICLSHFTWRLKMNEVEENWTSGSNSFQQSRCSDLLTFFSLFLRSAKVSKREFKPVLGRYRLYSFSPPSACLFFTSWINAAVLRNPDVWKKKIHFSGISKTCWSSLSYVRIAHNWFVEAIIGTKIALEDLKSAFPTESSFNCHLQLYQMW